MDHLDLDAWKLIAKALLTVSGTLLAFIGSVMAWVGGAAIGEIKKMRESVEDLNTLVASVVATQGSHGENFRSGQLRMDQYADQIRSLEIDVAGIKQSVQDQRN